jgi:phosphomannomutase
MKNVAFWGYMNLVGTSQETHYVSATEPSQLMLCKIWGSHGGDYEECLLGYKNPVRTSQETHYLSATESSKLMLCNI